MKLKKKIEEIIVAYKANYNQSLANQQGLLEEWTLKASNYVPEFIHKTISDELQSIKDEDHRTNKVFNQKLNAVIADAKKEAIPQNTDTVKSADYAMKVNTAVQLLLIEGKEITDETAFMILKDFVDDYDQMKIFKHMIGKYVELEDSTGNSNLPKTLGQFNQIEAVINTLEEIETIANILFVYPKRNEEQYLINNTYYSVSVDGYSELASEESILNLASVFDNSMGDSDEE